MDSSRTEKSKKKLFQEVYKSGTALNHQSFNLRIKYTLNGGTRTDGRRRIRFIWRNTALLSAQGWPLGSKPDKIARLRRPAIATAQHYHRMTARC
ncbi:hypothetical protein AO068_16355 [Pseudomonas sp. ICMP 3272]|uniref:Uncharacterized protein n=1 Tax=Pseudomonas savastanoi TaxID=29438 RepID=A0AAW3M619_PSESS|nr:hypothetical protein AO068_16355 [Pseudomonas sp. ICMP 3272]KTC55397.1 hypothetical protein AO258_17140 [Pseudomonas syringae ICMP 19498]KTC61642.1 hypothetical protein AO287_08670 [Pseudomonas savastanoi]RMQ07162.1 hypothetical protein ALQ09_101409 [Pseudomonas viridiflava]